MCCNDTLCTIAMYIIRFLILVAVQVIIHKDVISKKYLKTLILSMSSIFNSVFILNRTIYIIFAENSIALSTTDGTGGFS